ncbi:hypothetical protein GHT06_009909 [Daphnia sinensis]|uniref:DUF4806 domain-containing protein n=1 Tax=Daphnia sinensis TaxID=1820382 RepID=A0AAD5KXJ5_9CRUS|nr:hypothetical protein GHT06_009909 [Daphnia sinensis]
MDSQENCNGKETQSVPENKDIETVDDLINFEESLKEPDNYYAVVNYVRLLGGGSLSDAVKRAWSTYFSLKVKVSCNWRGKPRKRIQKHGLQKSLLTEAIFSNIMKSAPELFQRIQHSLGRDSSVTHDNNEEDSG